MSDWDPDQYRRFATERAQPFWDLVELVDPTTVGRMVDLGCGDGALSVQAAARLGAATLVGVDSSPAMLDRTAGLSQLSVKANMRHQVRPHSIMLWRPERNSNTFHGN